MLAVNHVTKKYGKFIALEDITLEFTRGVYGLLSPNGGGKTPLIKMLVTLLFPTYGEILWEGIEITKLGEQYRDIIGYLPQDFGYYKNQTPRQFLNYLAALKGIDRNDAERRATELLQLVSLGDMMDKKMRKFSGGMLQRVGIVQAMLNDPKILILDEPTSGLDPKERVRFRNLISELSKDRIVILSTHIVSDVETIANRVIMFKDHKLFCNDSPSNICKTLSGKVYETWDIKSVTQPYIPLTQRQEDGRTLVRFVCETGCPTAARQVTPNLEDVFLYVYRDEVI